MVALEEVDDGVYNLFFCFYHIGRNEVLTNKIRDIVSIIPINRAYADHSVVCKLCPKYKVSTMSLVCT